MTAREKRGIKGGNKVLEVAAGAIAVCVGLFIAYCGIVFSWAIQ